MQGSKPVSETVQLAIHAAWTEITLNRPDKLNSFNDDMLRAFREALEQAIFSGQRAILLTGAGRGFCAGQDLGDRDPSAMSGPPDLSNTLTTFYNPLVRLVSEAELPVVCAVNGVAAGAGANLAIACDLVLASDKARFIQSFARVGLVPDAGGSWHLTRLLGAARARALALTGEPLSAEQAAEWGLIYKVVSHEGLLSEARALTAKLSEGPTLGFAHTKKAISAAASNTLQQQLELEAEYQKTCGESADYAEGVAAFLNKRDPTFAGR